MKRSYLVQRSVLLHSVFLSFFIPLFVAAARTLTQSRRSAIGNLVASCIRLQFAMPQTVVKLNWTYNICTTKLTLSLTELNLPSTTKPRSLTLRFLMDSLRLLYANKCVLRSNRLATLVSHSREGTWGGWYRGRATTKVRKCCCVLHTADDDDGDGDDDVPTAVGCM